MTERAGSPVIDAPHPVRAGEELDVERLARALRALAPDAMGVPEVAQFPRGFSNLTYLVRWGGEEWVLRRPPAGERRGSAHDVAREYRILAALHPVIGLVPRPFLLVEDPAVLGAPFYVMERVAGVILRGGRDGVVPEPALIRQVARAAIGALAAIHAVDWRGAGLEASGSPEGHAARQVAGWGRRWQAARTEEQPEVERALAWLEGNVPTASGATLIHNDFKYDNLVLDPDDLARIRAVLDWEMATVGDPLLDLGTTLAYWVEPGDDPTLRALGIGATTLPGNPTREEVVQAYAAASGRDVGDVVFAYVYGLFKVAAIAQQILFRYRQGHTRDERFAHLGLAVTALGVAAVRAIERRTIAPA
jgi:aminoglycoside phosphotransferase (APT) family kinase protein